MDDGLFGPVDPTPVQSPPEAKGVKWSPCKGLRLQCDHCVAVVHLARRGETPPPIRSARHRRMTRDGVMVLCFAHAEIQKQKDRIEQDRMERLKLRGDHGQDS